MLNFLTKKKNPKITLYIMGACGNQFFQYAFARYIQKKTGIDNLYINYKYVSGNDNLWKGSDNLLKDFKTIKYIYETKRILKDRILSVLRIIQDVLKLKGNSNRNYRFLCFLANFLPFFGIYYFDSQYYPFKISRNKNIIINGFFESPKYFAEIDDIIKSELLPDKYSLEQNKELLNKIEYSNSVCITIKRMDIEDARWSDMYYFDMSYFYRAVEYIKTVVEKPCFFIFSDNIQWCKDNFKIKGEVYYETENNPIWEKIRLMSSCKHFIIHNSTFSWWAQHLSAYNDKIVVAPSKWLICDAPIDIYEDNWIYITPSGDITNKHE